MQNRNFDMQNRDFFREKQGFFFKLGKGLRGNNFLLKKRIYTPEW